MNARLATSLGGLVLAIDASTALGTVAVLRDGVVVEAGEIAMRGEREERLMPAVVDALTAASVAPNDLAAIICGAGPGGFTSLRIAASIAKGLAQAAAVPLWVVPSLALSAAGLRIDPTGRRYIVTFDALRGESYAALVSVADGEIVGYEPLGVVATATLPTLAGLHHATLLAHAPHARDVVALGALLDAAGPVDLDAWEPDYGRKAEAQVKWEAAHGRVLPQSAGTPA
jgi:tRNA threonylcarbamoyladenosine biosynthesis protein TsaB